MRSHALHGRERLSPTRADWAATRPLRVREPLPLITKDALARPETAATRDRLSGRDQAWFSGGWPAEMGELRERGSAIRRETLRDLEGYLRQLTDNVVAAGGQVHLAATPEAAAGTVRQIARRHGVDLAVKSKSMVTEEIGLNHALAEDGVQAVETDLGEYIVQLADERPAHIIAPAVHKSRADVAEMFRTVSGEPLSGEPSELTAFARRRLRTDFRNAGMGLTGVNFACADTGTLALVTNEGNARMVTSHPRVHVAVMSVEKVIPRFADLGVLVPLLTYAGTRKQVPGELTMITGPRRAGEHDGPEELHLVILDNGRTRLLGTRYEDVLACIRCGACQIACPVYRTVGGGHPYASVYGGPIGAVLTPLLGDRGEGQDLPFLSSLCGACADVCPVQIPLPDMLVDLRADYTRKAGRRRLARIGWRLWSRAWEHPLTYRCSVTLAGLVGRLPAGLLARLPGPARGWAKGRTLPSLRDAGALRRWFRRRGRPVGTRR